MVPLSVMVAPLPATTGVTRPESEKVWLLSGVRAVVSPAQPELRSPSMVIARTHSNFARVALPWLEIEFLEMEICARIGPFKIARGCRGSKTLSGAALMIETLLVMSGPCGGQDHLKSNSQKDRETTGLWDSARPELGQAVVGGQGTQGIYARSFAQSHHCS
jgi:hypothetical protein